ncbi:MAG TPA: type IV secretion system protein VirB10 [Steroidobacteraceae bacterium]|nr:type IV secretion system protein VirB10 [Steroidobacteraceae bacterium]
MIRFPWRRGALLSPREKSAADAESGADSPGSVRGERGAFITSGARSLQSRMSSVLAAGLMVSVGAAMLAWYYVEALSRPAAVHVRASAPLAEAPGEGMTLPPFGPITPPASARPAQVATGAPPVSTLTLLQSAATGPVAAQPVSSLLEPPLTRAPGVPSRSYGGTAQTSRQQALDRRLSGGVFAGTSFGSPPDVAAGDTGAGATAALPAAPAQERVSLAGPPGDSLQTLLRPSVLAATRAQVLPTQRLLLPKGTFVDCTLETAIDSTLPGMTTCITATDTFSADGTVVLLERGTKLIGQTRGEVRQGEARVFVVWTEARTPAGVVVQLDSPGTDALGRSGLEGSVNRHFWQRFGAAALVSTLDGVVQSEVQSSARGGTVVLDPAASEDVLTGILRSTVSIAPTVRVRNGARIQVLVARDVDFRAVYELESR